MKSNSSLLKTLILGTALSALPAEAADVKQVVLNSTRAKVGWIVDGDTFDATLEDAKATPVRIRIKGIDCPESKVNDKCIKRNGSKNACQTNELPRGRQATRYAIEKMKGKTVTLDSPLGKNVFEQEVRGGEAGRILSYVILPNGKDFGFMSIASGHCENNDRFPHPRSSTYEAAEEKAANRK